MRDRSNGPAGQHSSSGGGNRWRGSTWEGGGTLEGWNESGRGGGLRRHRHGEARPAGWVAKLGRGGLGGNAGCREPKRKTAPARQGRFARWRHESEAEQQQPGRPYQSERGPACCARCAAGGVASPAAVPAAAGAAPTAGPAPGSAAASAATPGLQAGPAAAAASSRSCCCRQYCCAESMCGCTRATKLGANSASALRSQAGGQG